MGLVHKVSIFGILVQDFIQRAIFRHFNHACMEHMARVCCLGNANERAFAISTAGVRYVSEPSASFAKNSNRVKVESPVHHGMFTRAS